MTARLAGATEPPDGKRNALEALGLEPGDRLEIPAFDAPLGHKAFAESQRRLFGAEIDGNYGMPTWPVAVNYVIRDGLILPAEVSGQPADTLADAIARARADDGVVRQRGGPVLSPYRPMSRPELPSELAKVANGKEPEVLAFVRCYGLLGYAHGLSDLERAALVLAKQSTTPVFGPKSSPTAGRSERERLTVRGRSLEPDPRQPIRRPQGPEQQRSLTPYRIGPRSNSLDAGELDTISSAADPV
jgi:hypothetical protein